MTALLVFIIIVLIILGLAVWGVQQLTVPEQPFKSLIILAMVLIACLVIANRAGVL